MGAMVGSGRGFKVVIFDATGRVWPLLLSDIVVEKMQ